MIPCEDLARFLIGILSPELRTEPQFRWPAANSVFCPRNSRVRLWDQDTLIEELLDCYEELNEELKAELPFKRVWAIANPDS